MRNNIQDVSNLLQQAMQNLIDPEKPGDDDIQKALAIAKLGSVQVQMFKMQVDYMKACEAVGLTPKRIPQLEPNKSLTLSIRNGKPDDTQDS